MMIYGSVAMTHLRFAADEMIPSCFPYFVLLSYNQPLGLRTGPISGRLNADENLGKALE